MRPTPELLDIFLNLTELDKIKRNNALKSIVAQKKTLNDDEINKYFLERLIGGLASSRAAARLGFSTALLMILSSENEKSYSVQDLLDVAAKKIDLEDKTVGNAHIIGYYLLLTAMVHCGKYNSSKDAAKIIETLQNIKDFAQTMTFPIIKLFADFSLILKEKVFYEHANSFAEQILDSTNVSYTPENVTFALLLRQKYPKVVSKFAKFVKSDGKSSFPEDSYSKLLLAVKRCESSNFQTFIDLLLSASNDNNSFELLYNSVIEPWALASNEAKVLDRIFGVVRNYFDNGANPKLIVHVFSREVLNRMEMSIRGKGQFRLLRNSVQNFGNYVKSKLETLHGEEAFKVLQELESKGNVDRASSVGLTTTLLANLDKKHVKLWIQENVENQDQLRKITIAFSSWDEKSRSTVLSTLLSQKSTETIQSVVTGIIDSLFYVKNRAGEFASIQLSDHNEQVLRQLVVTVDGEENVKNAEKILTKSKKRSKIWSAVSPDSENASSYDADSEEILAIVKNEKDKNNSQVFVDLLIGIMSKEKKFHRTPVAFAFAHALSTLKSKDFIHIVETGMMGEKELIDEDLEDEEGTPFDVDDIPEKEEESDDDEDEDDEDNDLNESVDQELLNKLKIALGEAADEQEENSSDKDMDDLDDEQMIKMDEQLAAAFKAIAPKSTKKTNIKNVEALKMKLADILLIAISSSDVKDNVKLKLIIPLLRWAKIDQKLYVKVSQRVVGLIGIIVKIKITGIDEKEAIELFKQIIEESQSTTNILITDIAAKVISFSLRISSSEENKISAGVKAEFLQLFDTFFKGVEGKIPAEFVIKPIIEHPKLFLNDLNLLINAGFNEDNRIFKRTVVLNAVSLICVKHVVQNEKIDKSFFTNLGKKTNSYLQSIIKQDSSEIKPRLFATVLRVLVNVASAFSENEQTSKVLKDSINSSIIEMSTGDIFAKFKKMNSACQQIIGKSYSGVLETIRKKLDIELN